jgi:methionyl-tRNA formyltransferase
LILPKAVLEIPRHGCLNIHPSLLPRWRGAAPIQRTIFAGDQITGVAIMQMDEGLDTGPVLLLRHYDLAPLETSQTLHDQLAKLGADALVEALDLLSQDKLIATPQAQDNVTYAKKITKDEAIIDWHQAAIELEHKIRAFNPWPVAQTIWQGQTLRVWMAKTISQATHAVPGTIVQASHEGLDIATGAEVLRLLQVQVPGGKVLSIADFYNAYRNQLKAGNLLA